MQAWSATTRIVVHALISATIAATTLGVVHAQGFDFSTFQSGGGGGTDPNKKRIVGGSGAYVCLKATAGSSPDSVVFTIWSHIPQPKAAIGHIVFDMGRYSTLFKSVSVALASPGVKARLTPAQPHAFLPSLKPTYWISIEAKGGHTGNEGLTPGRLLSLTAKLAEGKTIADVAEALHLGMNPVSGAGGVRVGVIIYYMLGGPPPGVATISDDGGFIMTRPSEFCR